MSAKNKVMHVGFRKAYDYLGDDFENNLSKMMNMFEKIVPENYEKQVKVMHDIVNDPQNNWYKLLRSIWSDIDVEVGKTFLENFFINSIFDWSKRRTELQQKYDCNIPWTILLDPTSACNLHCTGCWAAEYGNKLNLSFDEIDDIIMQGKDLGIKMYIYTGGEPLMRKNDLIALCNKHSDCIFLFFTNATLIDEAFADEMLKVKNIIPAISVEGFEEATDSRRGEGTYQKVIRAMEILKAKKLPFGVSCCYTAKNIDSMINEDFFRHLVDLGAKFAWFFHYMPVGNDAALELLPTAEQRELVYHRIREYRNTVPLFTIDFQNDGEYVGGCIAGGRSYLHINPNGDIEPCVFIHYSDSNIHEKSILDALRSPLFMQYHQGQPFNENHLRPCPMLENPDKLYNMVKNSHAVSTDLQSPEDIDHVKEKCEKYAADWAVTADKLWQCSHGCHCRQEEHTAD